MVWATEIPGYASLGPYPKDLIPVQDSLAKCYALYLPGLTLTEGTHSAARKIQSTNISLTAGLLTRSGSPMMRRALSLTQLPGPSGLAMVMTPYFTFRWPMSSRMPLASAFESRVFRLGAPNALAVSIGLKLTARPRCHHPTNTGMTASQPRRESRTAAARNQ